MLKSLILLKLGTIFGCVEILPSTRISVAILNSLGDTRSPRPHLKMAKSAHFLANLGYCVFLLIQTAYEQAQEARNACVDLFKEFTRIMVDDAAQVGTKVIQKRKVGNQTYCSLTLAADLLYSETSLNLAIY